MATDADIGLTSFLTSTPPVGGRLKVRVSDFVVDEEGGEPAEHVDGRFTCAVVKLTNWETNLFVRDASERLGISRKKIRFSGTKDKRGITTRVFTFEAPIEAVVGLGSMPGVVIERAYRTDDESELGQHVGNRFTIVVRDIPHAPSTLGPRIEAARRDAEEKGGYPNVFGPQRFGAVRATTHLVGQKILHGEFLAAIQAYLSPGPANADDAQRRAWDTAVAAMDAPTLLRLSSPNQTFERAMLNRLVQRPDDAIGALLALPKNLQLLFVSAYQSFLFNRIVCRRIDEGLPIGQAVEGDLVAPFESGEMKEEWVPTSASNLARVNDELRRGRAVITAVLPGTEVPFAEGTPGAIERDVLQQAGVTRSNFIVPEHLEWSSKGTRRAICLRPTGWSCTTEADDLHPGRAKATIRFSLPRGAYATSVLREILKLHELSAYG